MHGMKVVERVLENRLCIIVSVDEMKFGFMYEIGTIDAVFILRRMQEKYHAKGKHLYMCFMDLEKAFDRVPRKVLAWPMRRNGIPNVLVRSVMILYEGAKTRVRVDSELSEEFSIKIRMHQWSIMSPFLFAIMVDVVIEFAREGALSELLYADDLIMMSETIMGLRNKFLEWKEAFESEGSKVNLGKTKVMVCGGITMDCMYKSKVDPYSLRVKANSVLCLQSGKCNHSRCG